MADENDKPTLTRRRVLGSMATIGAAGAVGAGAWAQYSDEETARVKAEAGTLNLTIDGKDGNPSKRLDVGPLAPGGDGESRSFRLKNEGNIGGTVLGLMLDTVDSSEGTNNEAETNTGGGGELDDQLEVRAYVVQSNSNRHFFGSSGSNNWVDYSSVAGEEYINEDVDPMEADDLVIEVRMEDVSNNNAAQGDTLTFDADVTLYQNSAPSSS
ncbi:TasA family protein [Halococcus agarilyticus]|uniref:TasA family protein n=1 Tax=Halococcus agarilyticus TaxID=1232219 RepID=UPI000677637A|nr:TasA family protein [Halococcus agarilyticus]